MAVKILTLILNNAIYKIRTGHGVAAQIYTSNALCRVLGVGQGSCAAPVIWAEILDAMVGQRQKHFYRNQRPHRKNKSQTQKRVHR